MIFKVIPFKPDILHCTFLGLYCCASTSVVKEEGECVSVNGLLQDEDGIFMTLWVGFALTCTPFFFMVTDLIVLVAVDSSFGTEFVDVSCWSGGGDSLVFCSFLFRWMWRTWRFRDYMRWMRFQLYSFLDDIFRILMVNVALISGSSAFIGQGIN